MSTQRPTQRRTQSKEPQMVGARLKDDSGRRGEVIDVAARMFHKHGYAAASIQDIADELGILKGSVYHYISSKDDLLFAVIEGPHQAGMELVAAARADGRGAPERLRTFIADHLWLTVQDKIKFSVFLHDFEQLSAERRQTVRDERRRYAEFLEELLREGQREGAFRADLDARVVTLGLLGMLNGAHRWIPEGDQQAAADVAATFYSVVTAGIDV